MESEQVGFLFVWSLMEIHMSRVRIWIILTSLTIDIYMTRESLDPIKQFNHRDLYISLTMDNSMSSESYDPPYIVVPSLN